MQAEWVLGFWNGIVSLVCLLSIIYCLTNENYPMWQRLVGLVIIVFIAMIMLVD